MITEKKPKIRPKTSMKGRELGKNHPNIHVTHKSSAAVRPFSMSSRALYRYYKNHPSTLRLRGIKDNINEFKYFRRVVNAIYAKIAEKMLDKEGGVVVEGLGYFAHWRTPKGIVTQNEYDDYVNKFTDGAFYVSYLFNDIYYKKTYKGWRMDKAFVPTVKIRRYVRLLKGYKYKCYYFPVHAMKSRCKRPIKKYLRKDDNKRNHS